MNNFMRLCAFMCALMPYLSSSNIQDHIQLIPIPTHVKQAIKALNEKYPELESLIDIALFIDDSIEIAPRELIHQSLQDLSAVLNDAHITEQDPEDPTLEMIKHYISTQSLLPDLECIDESNPLAKRDIIFITDSGYVIPAAGFITFADGSNISSTGGGSTIAFNLSNNPIISGTLTANAVSAATTISAGTTLTAGTGLTVTSGGINSTGTTTLNSLSAGVMNTNGSGVVASASTTNHAVQIGNASSSLTSLGVGTNGQVLVAATTADPAFATISSTNSTITVTGGANTLNLDTAGKVAISFPTGSGTAVPSAGALTIAGGSNISTTGSGSTVTVNVSGTTNHAVQVGTGSTGLTSLAVGTNGQVLVGANTANPAFATISSTNSTITVTGGANTLNLDTAGKVAISFPTGSGTAVPSVGALTIAGGSNISTTGSGSTVTVNVSGTTNHAVQVGTGSTGLTSLTVGTNGQVLVGSTGANPAFATLGSADGSILYTTGAASLSLKANPLFGYVARVDAQNGNNSTGAVNGLPFLTISAAITAAAAIANSTTPVTVFVLPGIYNETLTMAAYVSVIGATRAAGTLASPAGGVVIQKLAVTGATTLVTMADNCLLKDVSLVLTSATLAGQVGILFPSSNTSNATSLVDSVNLYVNQTAGSGGNNMGINVLSTGTPSQTIIAVNNCNISVANSVSNSIGINVGTPGVAIAFNINNSIIQASGATNGVALQVNTTGACVISNSALSGSALDLETLGGAATLQNTVLVNQSVYNGNNAQSFTGFPSSTLFFDQQGGLSAGTIYMLIGTISSSASVATESFAQMTISRACIIKNLTVRVAGTSPSSGTVIVTIRKNGVSSALTATVAANARTASDPFHSIDFAQGDLLSVQVVIQNSSGAQLQVSIEVY